VSTSEGSPVIPPTPPQHWLTGDPGVGVVPPMRDHTQHPQQSYGHRPPQPRHESDEESIVMPSTRPVAAQAPAETAPPVTLIIPPPGAARPVSPSRESSSSLSSSSSSGPSTSTPYVTSSDVQRIPYCGESSRSRRTSPSSRSSSSFRTLPPGPTTIVNAGGPQPPTAMMPPPRVS
jgi:hypothetical protein